MRLDLNKIRFSIAAILSLVVMSFLFSKIDARAVLSTIYDCDLRLIVLAVFISFFSGIYLGTEKWRRILSALDCALPYREVLFIYSGCISLNVIFPMKSSELLKAYYLKKHKNLPFMRVVSSVLLDKILKLFVLLVIFLIGLFFVDLQFPRLIPAVLLLFVMLFLFSVKVRKFFVTVSKTIHPKVHKSINELVRGFNDINIREKFILIAYSVLVQISKFFTAYILFKAAGITVPFVWIVVLIPLVMIIANLPIAILGLGTREASIVFLFAKYGTSSALLSCGILISFVEHLLPAVFGLFFIKSFLTGFIIERPALFVSGVDK